MLKKLEFYYDEDHEKINIVDKKIYWDTKRNQFRHKFNCCDCGISLDCMCYDTLRSALSGVFEGFSCNECSVKFALNEIDVDEMLCYIEDDDRKNKIINFMDVIITPRNIDEFKKDAECDALEFFDKMEIIRENDKENTLKKYAIQLLTDEEKNDIMFTMCDDYPEGESCNL